MVMVGSTDAYDIYNRYSIDSINTRTMVEAQEVTPDMFTANARGRMAVHIPTSTIVIVIGAMWYKGQISYDVLVPIVDETTRNKQPVICNATYEQGEIKMLDKYLI